MDIIFSEKFPLLLATIVTLVVSTSSLLIMSRKVSSLFFKTREHTPQATRTATTMGLREVVREVIELKEKINGSDEILGLDDRIRALNKKIDSLDISDEIKKKFENDLNQLIGSMINNELSDEGLINSAVESSFRELVKNEVSSNIAKSSIISEITNDISSKIELDTTSDYVYQLDTEYDNSLRFKEKLMNLFIAVNLIMLFIFFIFLFFMGINSLVNEGHKLASFPTELSITFSGLYVSFAAFVIYVVRFSNTRVLTILSLKEELSKRKIISDYLNSINNKENVTDSDVAIFKLLTINRSQREQKTSHPYEVFLHGISGSNIQFKGGKLQIGQQKNKDE